MGLVYSSAHESRWRVWGVAFVLLLHLLHGFRWFAVIGWKGSTLWALVGHHWLRNINNTVVTLVLGNYHLKDLGKH